MVFPGGLRRLVRAEVLTDNPSVPAAAAESAAREWRNLNDAVCWQPPRVRDVTDGIRPASRPPLIAAGISVPERRALALTTASEAGLIRYLWMRPDAGTFGVSVTVGGDTVVRTLHGSTVTAWIRGVADGAGRPDVLEGIV